MTTRLAHALLLVMLLGCARAPERGVGRLKPCAEVVDAGAFPGGLEGCRCRWLEVPEDHANPDGRWLKLRVVVAPARARTPAPDPVVLLAGGPGQAAPDVAPMVLGRFKPLRETRDLVFLDQRGAGGPSALTCEIEAGDDLADLLRTDPPAADLARCRGTWDADLRHYGTADAAADVEALRQQLGAPRLNLYGVSYGSRLAMEVARAYPGTVRALVLDGVAPPALRLPLPMAPDGRAALAMTLSACTAEPACRTALGDVTATWARVEARLSAAPRVHARHPRTGADDDVDLPPALALRLLSGALMTRESAALVPLAVARLDGGDAGPLLALADLAALQGPALGLHLAVVCAEDLPRITAAERAESATDPLAALLLGHYDALCGVLALPPRPVESLGALDVPALLLSGERDPVTPPRWAEVAGAALPAHRHLIVAGAAHGAWQAGCVPEVAARFLDALDPTGLDATCLDRVDPPHFFLRATGPIEAMPGAEEAR